jgi:predicted Holliday junction resolvase-like endonuclease
VGAQKVIAWIIALILFTCLLIVLIKLARYSKELKALSDRYEAVLHEAKTRRSFAEEAWNEVEKWKKRYLAEKTVKEEKVKEAEKLRKRYWQEVHEDSDSYKTQTRKEEESWGDKEPY